MILVVRPLLGLTSLGSIVGAAWLVVDSFTEHFDVVKAILVVTLSIVAWFLIDLKLRVERVQREHSGKIEAYGLAIERLKSDGGNRQRLLDRLAHALDQHMEDEHRYQLYVLPRIHELTKHLIEGAPPKMARPQRLHLTGELRQAVPLREPEPAEPELEPEPEPTE